MKKNKKRIEGRYIILLIILALILFLAFFSYTLKNKKELNTFEKIIKDTFNYTEKFLMTPINYTKNLVNDFTNLRKVKKEKENICLLTGTLGEGVESVVQDAFIVIFTKVMQKGV